jgi:hypothetical protein
MNRPGIVILTFMFLLTSCEKEKDFGKALYSGDEMISYLCWSEYGDKIFFAVESSNFRKTVYGVDVNSGDSWKVGDITSGYGSSIYEYQGRIYYFNDANYQNVKLFSLDASGGTPEMKIDSLESPLFSKRYVAFMKSYFLTDTILIKTVLYDLDNESERAIESTVNLTPAAISPDGTILLLRWVDYYNYMLHLSMYNTETGEMTDLPSSQNLYYSTFFWKDNEAYAFGDYGTGMAIFNVSGGQKLAFPEPLSYANAYSVSPSGSILAYIVSEYPAIAEGWVGSHYYLHILKTGASQKIVIDMEREPVTGNTLVFSPDETRIAYVRDNTDIYVLTIN